MSCPLGFTSLDGPNPHKGKSQSIYDGIENDQPHRAPQPPQKDGRVPPKLPPRPSDREKIPWHLQTKVTQGPIPFWASLIAAWYNYLWGIGRVTVFTFFLLAITPILHVLSWMAIGLAERISILRPVSKFILMPALRVTQSLYTGLGVCLFESIASARYMFSGKVSNTFWDRSLEPTNGALPAAQCTVFVSNQTSYSCFLDCIVFFSLAYRRKQTSNLYFLPFDMQDWGIGSGLLHLIFLSPLTVYSTSTIDYLISTKLPLSFVWFPESTLTDDVLASIPIVHQSTMPNEDLLHVQVPHLSKMFIHIVSTTVATGIAPLDIIDCTIAYTGSVQAELEASYETGTGNGALDYDEEEEFERAAENPQVEPDESCMDGYSAETINNAALGSIHSRVSGVGRKKFQPTIPVFCTAAPLKPLAPEGGLSGNRPRSDSFTILDHRSTNGRPTSTAAAARSSSPTTASRAALLRQRVVPSFAAFLSGNAPTQVHVLLNQYDTEWIKSRIIKVEPAGSSSSSASSKLSNGASTTHLSLAEEAAGSSLAVSLDSWLQQRFMHQEQQLTLFAVHSCFHRLPASVSASSIPISKPLEAYAFPVSSIKLLGYVLLDWLVIIVETVIFREVRAVWNGNS